MKKFMITAALIIGISGLALAQKGKVKDIKTPEQRAELLTASMDKDLHLSADQHSKIYALNLKQFRERAAVKSGNGDKDAFKASRKEDRKQLAGLLNNDQKKAFRALKKQRGHGKHQGREKPPVTVQQKA